MINGSFMLNVEEYKIDNNDDVGATQLHLNENLFESAILDANEKTTFDNLLNKDFDFNKYPTGGVNNLIAAISENLSIERNQVIVSNGSSSILFSLFLALLKKGDTVLLPSPSWKYYTHISTVQRLKTHFFHLMDKGDSFYYDLPTIEYSINKANPKAVVICSLNNPTGNSIIYSDVLYLVKKYTNIAFILDEAYLGFKDDKEEEIRLPLIHCDKVRNLFIVRTFSKFYGLANLRIGYLISHKTNNLSLKILQPIFGIPTLVQEIAALRLKSNSYKLKVKREYKRVYNFFFDGISKIHGLLPYKTDTNFILIKYNQEWSGIEKELLKNRFIVKQESVFGNQNYIRITLTRINPMETILQLFRNIEGEIYAKFHKNCQLKRLGCDRQIKS